MSSVKYGLTEEKLCGMLFAMKLHEYLEKYNYRYTTWAKEKGISEATLHRYLNGLGVSPKSAKQISQATNGEVGILEVLYPDD